jgi:prophage regulatory protein
MPMGNRVASKKKRGADNKRAIQSRPTAGVFPPPVRIGLQAVGWPESEVCAVLAARIRGVSDDEMRALVSQLVEARAQANGNDVLLRAQDVVQRTGMSRSALYAQIGRLRDIRAKAP